MATGRPPFTAANHIQLLQTIETTAVTFPDTVIVGTGERREQ